jgi:hypothetical protein
MKVRARFVTGASLFPSCVAICANCGAPAILDGNRWRIMTAAEFEGLSREGRRELRRAQLMQGLGKVRRAFFRKAMARLVGRQLKKIAGDAVMAVPKVMRRTGPRASWLPGFPLGDHFALAMRIASARAWPVHD